MKVSTKGTVRKIRVLPNSLNTLVRLTLETNRETFNCIAARKEIVDKILILPEETKDVSVFGHMNKKNQLVIEKLACQNNISYYGKGA